MYIFLKKSDSDVSIELMKEWVHLQIAICDLHFEDARRNFLKVSSTLPPRSVRRI